MLVLNVIMTVNPLFLPKAALLSIYLLLKPLSSKLPPLPSADEKNLCTNDALSLIFFQPITARLFPTNNRSFSCASILTIFLDNCQTTSCFEDMNILIKAIVSFYCLSKCWPKKKNEINTSQTRLNWKLKSLVMFENFASLVFGANVSRMFLSAILLRCASVTPETELLRKFTLRIVIE